MVSASCPWACPAVLQHTGNIKFDLQLGPELATRAACLREQYRADTGRFWWRPAPTPERMRLSCRPSPQCVRPWITACWYWCRGTRSASMRFIPSATRAGWQVVRRSSGAAPGSADDIVLGDTMGELLLLLSVASVVVMGGSLVPHGGHNVLEAAAWGVPVVSGPHMFNFEEVTRLLVAAGAMVQLEQLAAVGRHSYRAAERSPALPPHGRSGATGGGAKSWRYYPRAAATGALSAARWHPRVSEYKLTCWRWPLRVAVGSGCCPALIHLAG